MYDHPKVEMYHSHKQLLRKAEELRHRRNVISEDFSLAKVSISLHTTVLPLHLPLIADR